MPAPNRSSDEESRISSGPPSASALLPKSEPPAALATRRFWLELGSFVLALVLVSFGAAGFAIVFRYAISFVFQHFYGASDVLSAFRALPFYACLLVPAAGGALAGWLSARASLGKEGRSVGEVMEAVVLGKVRLSLLRTCTKALGSWVAIVTGGSVGREGSIISFGGALGSAAGQKFRLRGTQIRALTAAGSAAGFAAAYNTPLAAVLFVAEVVTGVIALEVLLPVILAVPIATALTRAVVGGGPIYGQRAFTLGSDLELALPALLGVLAGVLGPAFMVLLARGERAFARLPWPKPARAALGGLTVGALALGLPQLTGNGYEAINLLLSGKVALATMLILLVGKAFATTASVASGSPGGVFTPSLFIGAALGAAFGHLVAPSWSLGVWGELRLLQVAPGYALLGMAAMSAATTHAPVMAAVMVFELSGDYAIVLPLLIATATATLVSRRLHRDSIYGEELKRYGVAWDITLAGRRMRAKTPFAPPPGPSAGEDAPDRHSREG